MIALATILAASASMLGQQHVVEHRGASYEVRYEPHVTVNAKTVGAHAGTRRSGQLCRWSVAVQVERHIGQNGADDRLSRVLPHSRNFTGNLPGDCRGKANAIRAAQARQDDAIRAHVATVAGA
ncbi:MAG: hypothetical protein ABW048_04880, partial [Sphingobium sp.]